MVTVVLLGNGAREHAVAEALSTARIHAYMSQRNPGIAELAERVHIGKYDDLDAIVEFSKGADLAFIGPEAPLAAGVVDALEESGVPCVGPKMILARLETSKAFTRELLDRNGIPGNPRFKVFTDDEGISEWIVELGEYVVKADGLHGGKGVKVSGAHLETKEEGVAYAKECIESDGRVVIEEKLVGEEFSLMAFTDGKSLAHMPCVQDHKRAYENDEGPNTGGMGSYSDPDHKLPFLNEEHIRDAMTINRKTLEALRGYKGVMYGGFIVTRDGVRLIEYNARLGDPEAMNVLSILETPLVDVCRAIVDGTLSNLDVSFSPKATVCKYVVPEGYPDNPVRGVPIRIERKGAKYYYAAIDERDGELIMTGSRAVGVVGIGETPTEAERIAEEGVAGVQGDVFYRKDIGTEELRQRRVQHMKELR